MAATTTPAHRLVSLPEAADILGLSVKTVRRYIAAGDLDAVRLGSRTIRVKMDSLDRLIDAHPVQLVAFASRVTAARFLSRRCDARPGARDLGG